MSSKKDSNNKKTAPELIKTDADVEERVRKMMDPSVKESEVSKAASSDDPATAPEVTDLPVPKEPLKIKILHDDDSQDDDTDVPTAPELSSVDAIKSEEPEKKPTPEEAIQTEGENEKKESVESEANQTDHQESESPEPSTKEDELPEDPDTAKAVDDIVRKESDELLKAEDGALLAAVQPQEKKASGGKLKRWIVDLWKNPKKRKAVIASLVVVIVAAAAVPQSRYFILNTAGVRASASVHVLDQSTLQPLKNVRVSIHGIEARTDENGDARLEKLKLGPASLKVERRAFATVEREVTIGWGSNPLGEEKLTPTGTQYAFHVTDLLSGKGVVKAEAVSGDASAFSDEQGKILLTMENPPDEIDVRITAEGRRTENPKLNADSKAETEIKMVPARKHAYISRREGRYDIYAAYADGKEEALVLRGSGSERDDMVLVAHPSEDMAALVSTREGKRNKDGFLMSNLTIVDLRTKSVELVQTSERIQVIGWFGDRLAYVQVASGSSAASPKRNRLMAYHYKDDTNNELAAANYFNDVLAVQDKIYYAPSGAYSKGVNVSLFSVKPDGSERKIILNKEVWNMFRTAYDHIALSVPGAWYDYRLGQESPDKLGGEPADLKSRVYSNSPNNEKSIWIDSRDGKGVLIVHDVKTGKEKSLRTQSGLKNPLRWLNDSTVVYRIRTDSETADYALSLDGGEPKKIADVTNTDGIDRWYYY